MDNIKLVAFLAIQSFIAVASGEVAIRYFSWYITIFKKGVVLAPLVLGVAIVISGLCMVEIEWVHAELMQVIEHPEIPLHGPVNYTAAVLTRVWMFIGVCSLTWPVLKLQDRGNSVGHDITDTIIRLFIIIGSYIAGLSTATILWRIYCNTC